MSNIAEVDQRHIVVLEAFIGAGFFTVTFKTTGDKIYEFLVQEPEEAGWIELYEFTHPNKLQRIEMCSDDFEEIMDELFSCEEQDAIFNVLITLQAKYASNELQWRDKYEDPEGTAAEINIEAICKQMVDSRELSIT